MVSSRDTKQQFVNQHTFCVFARFKKKNGKHGDGVQQGELKENAKEEEKSAN